MEIIADFHVHSKYAGACSENISIENMDVVAKQKGINVIGTGDFTHPLWLRDIKSKLVEAEKGLFKRKGSDTGTRFILTGEVSNIFEYNHKFRKIHNCIILPDLETVEQVNNALSRFGKLESDGRPILSASASELVEIVNGINPDAFIFPAHAWTPWFGALGDKSGFDSIKEAYQDQARHIHALETGLSSDPLMNWRISDLDKYTLLSNSDAHSLPKLGREANVFEIDEGKLSYNEIIGAIKSNSSKRLKMTIEFYPEEGKYHYDGHRNCNISLSPQEAKKYNYICPVCRSKLTIGVMHRIEDLADRDEGYTPKDRPGYVHMVPLQEVIAYITKKGEQTKHVQDIYKKLIERFGTEFNVLIKSSIDEISAEDKELAKAITNIREEKMNVIPGYDGVFGIIDIFSKIVKKERGRQSSMSDF